MHLVPKIPGYELLSPLGGGLLTTVYAARECSNDIPCAVKVLRQDWDDQPTAIKLLQREARVGLVVRHQHLVTLLDVHVTCPPYFLVMELLGGSSLRRRLRRDYRLDVATAVWIARQIAEALLALHRAGFVHGDVKPENIRLVDDGTAVLIDLGFAHRPGENAALWRDGYILGTANYLAPELCGAEPNADQSSDLFSLGVTLFEMLAGTLPYPPESLDQLFHRRCNDAPADILQYVEHLPPDLVRLLRRLLARNPEDRPRTAAVVQQFVSLEISVLRQRRSA